MKKLYVVFIIAILAINIPQKVSAEPVRKVVPAIAVEGGYYYKTFVELVSVDTPFSIKFEVSGYYNGKKWVEVPGIYVQYCIVRNGDFEAIYDFKATIPGFGKVYFNK